MKPATILRELLALLTPRERCTQGAQARDANGNITDARSPTAVSWCAYGGIRKVCKDSGTDKILKLLRRPDGMEFYRWQDTHSYPQVLAAIRRAIKLAEAR